MKLLSTRTWACTTVLVMTGAFFLSASLPENLAGRSYRYSPQTMELKKGAPAPAPKAVRTHHDLPGVQRALANVKAIRQQLSELRAKRSELYDQIKDIKASDVMDPYMESVFEEIDFIDREKLALSEKMISDLNEVLYEN